MGKRISLKEAVKFHGHLGPYLVLGILAGELAIRRLKCRKYFGLKIKVWGATKKPKSCLIDGLQLSSGATYGKGNIGRLSANRVKIEFLNCQNNRKLILKINDCIEERLREAKTHAEAEALARLLYQKPGAKIFKHNNG